MEQQLEGEPMESRDASRPGPRCGEGEVSPTRGTRVSLVERTRSEMEEWCVTSGFPRFHGPQILRWVHERGVESFGEMTDLPIRLREHLRREGSMVESTVIRRDQAGDGTEKLLVRLQDGQMVECVKIPEGERRTVCVSTQVGCAVGCVFCASGLGGAKRNLTAGEILEQVIHLRRSLGKKERITSLVFMGMGEPLHNLTNLLRSMEVLCAPWGGGLGARRITVSTSGPPGRIPRLTEAGLPVHLAVSLHAPNDEIRRRMIPGKTSSVAELLLQSKEYFGKTGRRVTFEIALVEGMNCEPGLAKSLAMKVRPIPCLVNLIPMNPVKGVPFGPPGPAAVAAYRKELECRGIEVVVRKRKGEKIAAACGQLRLRAEVAGDAGAEGEPGPGGAKP